MYQLDIFEDSQSVLRTNDLIAALGRFEPVAAWEALHRLEAIAPAHEALSRFLVLCQFLERGSLECNTTADVAAGEQMLREQLTPAAMAMGSAASDWLRKCWSELAKSSERAGVAPQHPGCFSAELYLRAHQFSDVVRTARQVAGADFRAAVQRWLGLGLYSCGEMALSRDAAARYAWLSPQGFNAFVAEMGDAELARDWLDFQADLGDLDASWFPAWCVHENRAISTRLDNLPDNAGAAAYRLVTGLAIRERGGICPAVYEHRARLKRLDESFFEFYMKRRA